MTHSPISLTYLPSFNPFTYNLPTVLAAPGPNSCPESVKIFLATPALCRSRYLIALTEVVTSASNPLKALTASLPFNAFGRFFSNSLFNIFAVALSKAPLLVAPSTMPLAIKVSVFIRSLAALVTYLLALNNLVAALPPLPIIANGPTKGANKERPSPVTQPAFSQSFISFHFFSFFTKPAAPHVNPLTPPQATLPKKSRAAFILVTSSTSEIPTFSLYQVAQSAFTSAGAAAVGELTKFVALLCCKKFIYS